MSYKDPLGRELIRQRKEKYRAELAAQQATSACAVPVALAGDAALAAALPELARDGYAVRAGDACDRLAELPEGSVHLAATSPPYFQLRSYATGEEAKPKELGSEKTVAEFVENLVRVGEAVRRVVRDDGLFFVNLGDTYNTNPKGKGSTSSVNRPTNTAAIATGRHDTCAKAKSLLGIPWRVAFAMETAGWYLRKEIIWAKPNPMPESVMDRPTSSHETVFMFAKSTRNFWDKEAVREKGVIPAGTLGAKGSAERASTPGVNARPPEYKVYDGRRNLRDVWWIQTRPFKGAHFATFPAELVAPMILGGTSAAGVCVACGTPHRRVTELVGLIRVGGYIGGSGGGLGSKNPLAKLQKNGKHMPACIPLRDTIAWDPGCGPSRECDRCKGEGIIEVPNDLPEVAGPRQGQLAEDWPEEERPDPERVAAPVDVAADALEDGFEECPRCMGYGEIRTGCTSEKPVPALVVDPFLGSGTTVREAVRLGRRGAGFDLSEEYLEKYARPSIAAVARQPGLLGIG